MAEQTIRIGYVPGMSIPQAFPPKSEQAPSFEYAATSEFR